MDQLIELWNSSIKFCALEKKKGWLFLFCFSKSLAFAKSPSSQGMARVGYNRSYGQDITLRV